ncbi:DUF4435 domain-containing protein [bacterium]|nr:DUF4435 domain-containing protein [bacterium]
MKQFLTPHEIANTIRMMRPVYAGTVLMVEGDSDARVYGRFIDRKRCSIIPAHGKSNVLIAMGVLEKDRYTGILAVIDSDYWRMEGTDPGSVNILMTDTHDLETMILSSGALETVLAEFGSAQKIRKTGSPIREMILHAALPLGYLRWISSSKQDNLSLKFRDISFAAVIVTEGKTMRMDIDDMIEEVRASSDTVPFDREELRLRIAGLVRSNRHDPWQVCRGHDMIHILAIGLRTVFGGRHAKNISYEQIDSIMRIAFGFAEFSQTRLYSSLKKWERDNPDFSVFPG